MFAKVQLSHLGVMLMVDSLGRAVIPGDTSVP